MRRIDRIVVHHSAGHGGTLEEIRRLHTSPPPFGNGWTDIGYHSLITNGRDIGGREHRDAPDGGIFPGRNPERQGAHCRNHNKYTLGVCVTGSFEADPPSPAQIQALYLVLREWCSRYGVAADRDHIRGHKEMSGHETNSCPGRYLLAVLDKVVAKLQRVQG